MSRSVLAAALLFTVTLTALGTSQDEAPAPKNDWSRSKILSGRTKLKGDAKTRDAVTAALEWLLRHQREDGSWSSDGFTKDCNEDGPCKNQEKGVFGQGPGFPGYDEGVTALSLLAFLGRGNTHVAAERDDYRVALDKGARWLLSRQDVKTDDLSVRGRFVGGDNIAKWESWIYGHSIATIALAECLLGTGDTELLAVPVKEAAEYLLRCQLKGFGWHYAYQPGSCNSSVTVWVATALLLADECRSAGFIELDEAKLRTAEEGADTWLSRAWSEGTGGIGYQAPGDYGSVLNDLRELAGDRVPLNQSVTHSNTAAGLFYSRIRGRKDPKVARKAWKLLTKDLPRWEAYTPTQACTIDLYYWYYGAHAARQRGGGAWSKWSKSVKKVLEKHQRQDGCAKGSWDPIGAWGHAGGRVYSTAIGALALEAEYRYGKR